MGVQVARRLSPPESLMGGYDRMLAVAQQLQAAVGVAALAAVWLFPPYQLREQLLVTILLFGVYLPWTLLSRRAAVLRTGPVARILNLSFDLAAIGVFAVVIPSTRTAVMLAYALVVAFHAYVSGRTAGLAMAAGSLVLIGVAEWQAPAGARTDAFTLVMYVIVMVALAVMVDALAHERRRTARHLARLHVALEGLAADPSVAVTTDSIAEAAKQAVGAMAVMVLLPRDDLPDALQVAGGAGLPEDLRSLLRQSLRNPSRSPSGLAMRSGCAVAIPDLAADERFSWVAPTLARYGAHSLVAVPLGPPSNPIGVLNAYFTGAGGFDDDDVHLLAAYGRQASITVARALAFEQEQRAAARLAATDQLKSDFISTVTHELRTPLTSISGFVDTILLRWDQLDDAAKKEVLQRVARNSADLRRLVEQILTFATVDAAPPEDERGPYAVARGIEDLVEHMAPVLGRCRVEVDVDPDLVVLATPEAMQHVIGNLLTNACKFSPEGSVIRVVGRRDGDRAHIDVCDEGPGVPLEERTRIFDRFYRGTTTRSTRGTGIGLAIVKASVETLGGDIDLRDGEGGRGSTFEVTLPLASAAEEAGVLLL